MIEAAWRKTLFNQFHDILPGSCVSLTKAHAMGSFQDALSYINAAELSALRYISAKTDTSIFATS